MSNVTITPVQLVSLASAVHAASADDVTPIITSVVVERRGDVLVATATDRYRVAEVTVPLTDPSDESMHTPDFRVQVAGKAFDVAARAVARGLHVSDKARPSVTLTVTDDGKFTVTSGFGDASQTVPTVEGNFPPVQRLFPSDDALVGDCTPVAFNPAYLATMMKLHTPNQQRNASWTMHRQAEETAGKSRKPVLFRVGDKREGVRYLVQPNLLTR